MNKRKRTKTIGIVTIALVSFFLAVCMTAVPAMAAHTWVPDRGIVSGLTGTGDNNVESAPTVFEKDGTWYLISGIEIWRGGWYGGFYGYRWTGSTWRSDKEIVSGLEDVGRSQRPTVFNMDGAWYLISGEYDGTFNGYKWTGLTWEKDDAIVSGLGDIGYYSAPAVFNKDGTWYLISGKYDGTFNGYKWTGSTWEKDGAIVSGLGDIEWLSPLTVFDKDGTWHLISGEYDGTFNGYKWTCSAWEKDDAIVSGLGDVGRWSAPTVFDKDGAWYLISGEYYGDFYGYLLVSRETIPASVRITPETLKIEKEGEFTAYISLPDGYSVYDVDITSVECEDAHVMKWNIAATDNGTLIVKFNTADLRENLPTDAIEIIELTGKHLDYMVELNVIGKMTTNGKVFKGSDMVRVLTEDTIPPYTGGHVPIPGSTGVPIDTVITVHVKDDCTGVDKDTIVMTVEGSIVTPDITGKKHDYMLLYDPPDDFGCGEVINVTVDAADRASNIMPTDDYSFTTEVPDLVITAIDAYHYSTYVEPWFNLPNEVDVTVRNIGKAAHPSSVSLYADDVLTGKMDVPSIDAGASATVQFKWTPTGDDCLETKFDPDPLGYRDWVCSFTDTSKEYHLRAVADCDNDVAESDETNNEKTVVERACYNGYTGDEPLENVKHGTLRGGMIFTTGDGSYAGLYGPGSSKDTTYEITLPAGASVELARLNVYYTWYYEKEVCPRMEVSITNHQTDETCIVPLEKSYNDIKCQCPGATWVFPWGNYVYDLTEYIQDSGTYTVTVKNKGTRFSIAAPGIVVVYRDASKPLIEYWINEGADILIGGRRPDSGYLSLEESINNATFPGCINLSKVENAALGVVSPWGDAAPNDVLYFNGIEMGRGVYDNGNGPIGDISRGGIRMTGSGGGQVGVNLSDVTSYLDGSENIVGQGDDGDCMMPSNAFLVVEYRKEKPSTPFLIPFLVSGFVSDSDGIQVNNPNVTITNLNTGESFTVETDTGYNYYQVLTSLENVSSGDVLRFTCNETSFDHKVRPGEMDAGGFEQNVTLMPPPAPDFWVTDSGIAAELGDVGMYSAPAVFDKDGTRYLISGSESGLFTGYHWTGSAWQNDSAITSGLGDVGNYSTPAVFNKSGRWYLIAGEYDGVFTGYKWTETDSKWQSDPVIMSGLEGVDVGTNSAPTVFCKGGTWYLISGEKFGTFFGYRWSETGAAWQNDSAIVVGLEYDGTQSTPTVFDKDGTWYLITGEYDGVFTGFNWTETGSTWQSDPAIASGLGQVGLRSAPTVFDKDGTLYLISGAKLGEFYGYKER